MRFLISLFFTFCAIPAFAVTLEGYDGTAACSLQIHQEYFEGGARDLSKYRVEVSTSYAHGRESLGMQQLGYANNGAMLSWESPRSGQFIRLFLRKPYGAATDAVSFQIHWNHDDHQHDRVCENLR